MTQPNENTTPLRGWSPASGCRPRPGDDAITQLLEKWEARSRGANPCDAMLINKHIRELREAVARPQFAGFDVAVDPTLAPNEMKLVPAATTSVNCDECVHGLKALDQHPCDVCIHGRDFLSRFEPRFRAPKGTKT